MGSQETYFAIWNALTGYQHQMILAGIFMISFLLNLWVLKKRIIPSIIRSLILVTAIAILFIVIYLNSR